jgi:hypothetical protein
MPWIECSRRRAKRAGEGALTRMCSKGTIPLEPHGTIGEPSIAVHETSAQAQPSPRAEPVLSEAEGRDPLPRGEGELLASLANERDEKDGGTPPFHHH